MIGVSNKRKKLARGTMVQGTDKTYERSIYEVLADNGEVLLLVARKYGGNIINNYGTLCIRRKDRFEVVPAIDCLDVIPHKITSLGLPDNWVKDYRQISFSYGDKTFRKCVFIDLVEAFDGGDRYLDFKMKWEKELSNLNRISNLLNSK